MFIYSELETVVSLVEQGDYAAALQQPCVAQWLGLGEVGSSAVTELEASLLNVQQSMLAKLSDANSEAEAPLQFLVAAITLLYVFMQANLTG